MYDIICAKVKDNPPWVLCYSGMLSDRALCSMLSEAVFKKQVFIVGLYFVAALLVNSQGIVLTKSVFNACIKRLVARMGLDPGLYSAHSLRAGATTTAATLAKPFQDWELQVLGNWSSDTYKRYVRNLDAHTVKFSQRLTIVNLG